MNRTFEAAGAAIMVAGASSSRSKRVRLMEPTGSGRRPGRVGAGAHHWSVCRSIFTPPGLAMFAV